MNSWYKLIVLALLVSCSRQPKELILAEEDSTVTLSPDAGLLKLSDYGFFTGPLKELRPGKNVFAYQINAPLFSDYAGKKRFIFLPDGKKIRYHEKDVFDFPEGSVLIKNFLYQNSERNNDQKIIETRLLIREASGWKALPYKWNEDQTEAFLTPAGGDLAIDYRHRNGEMLKINYHIPNQTQCKNCHARGDQIMPIGPSARQLNNGAKKDNVLLAWSAAGILEGLPSHEQIPSLVSYENPTASLDLRARSWLEANCAHCHREDGPAKTSGLHLLAAVTDPLRLGIGKGPVAAGKGSGGRKYDIVNGNPEASILYYRIVSNDPGVMMPELGRSVVHKEGANLIAEWIREMK